MIKAGKCGRVSIHAMPPIAPQNTASSLRSFDDFLSDLGKTRTTGFRWRKLGLIEVVNIFGRLYVTRDAIEQFEEKAKRGDFAREVKTPTRRETAQAA